MKTFFEWLGKFTLCIIVATIVRVISIDCGAAETVAALWSGLALGISMFETGLLKAGVSK